MSASGHRTRCCASRRVTTGQNDPEDMLSFLERGGLAVRSPDYIVEETL